MNPELKAERDRFLKLAFCRADLLLELNHANEVVFAAGPTAPLFGIIESRLVGTPFLSLIADSGRRTVETCLAELADDARIDDLPTELKSQPGTPVPALLAGFKAREFDDHVFLAVKIARAAAPSAAAAEAMLADEQAFSRVAAQRIEQLAGEGKAAKVSLVRLRKFKELAAKMDSAEKQGLFGAIARVLRRYALGGDTAGRIDEEHFGFVHEAEIDPEIVNAALEEAALPFLPKGASIDAQSVTLDADGAGLSEEQVAKALVHSMQQFCTKATRLSVRSLTDAMDEMISGTMQTLAYFKEVSRTGGFDLVYMPVCDLRLGKVHHFEALSRFREAERAKTTFQIITLAESVDLIRDFDFAVIRKAVELIEKNMKAGRTPPPIAANLSGLSVSSEPFMDALHKFLRGKPGLERRLSFEMTESAGVEDLPRINRIIQSLRSRGFHFALDDFGAGSASFDYLNAFEIDVVKFDGPVVRRACSSKRGNDLLSTMSKMCSQAGIETIAEMVEDKKMANQVFYCGIDYGQGWYFGKPAADPFDFADNFAGT